MHHALIALVIMTASNSDPASPDDTIGWHASGKVGAVAAGGSGAVAAGIRLLQQGGNAADAAAATILALAITDYGWFAIGGEVPLLIYDAKRQEVKVLCGLGRAPLDQEPIDWLYEHGIPSTGSMKAAPVPGALLDAGGRDWYAPLAVTLRKLVEAEQNAPGTREQKLVAARDRFYKGDYESLDGRWRLGGKFPVAKGWATYRMDLTRNRWRETRTGDDSRQWGGPSGKVSSLRIDPGNQADRWVIFEEVRLQPAAPGLEEGVVADRSAGPWHRRR